MQIPLTLCQSRVWSLLIYTCLGFLVITVSACHREVNLIPYGYEGVFDDEARASTAARVDYSIVVTDPSKYNTFRVSKNGERTWFWQYKFWRDQQQSSWDWSPTWYRLVLQSDGMENPICKTAWEQKMDQEPQEVQCNFDATGYLSKPLLAMLFYKMGGDEKKPPLDDDTKVGVVARYYYLIPK
jgi:hypothetical protein